MVNDNIQKYIFLSILSVSSIRREHKLFSSNIKWRQSCQEAVLRIFFVFLMHSPPPQPPLDRNGSRNYAVDFFSKVIFCLRARPLPPLMALPLKNNFFAASLRYYSKALTVEDPFAPIYLDVLDIS